MDMGLNVLMSLNGVLPMSAMFKPAMPETGFVFSRVKMGVTITCHEINRLYVLRHNGLMIHATADDCRNDEVAREAAFYTAWNAVTGFEPMSVIRRLSNGRFRKVGMTFLPAGSRVERIKAGWHSVGIKFAN